MHGRLEVKGWTAVLAALTLSVLLSAPALGVVVGTDVTYTLDADFDQGTLVNVNHDAPNNNQLQLNETSGTFPFIWVALSQRCTIAKINTATGAILGEFRTISDAAGCNQSSRTTVAIDGTVWVGHRGPGGVTHVGLQELNQCVDRNGNGTIETSGAYGDVKAWSGSDSMVANAADECILHHVDTDAAFGGFADSRHMSIDAANNLWVGDFAGGHRFIRINGTTGAVETAPRSFACGGYGGLIDSAGVIWSANGGAAGLLRWDPAAADSPTNPQCLAVPNVYGLAVDQTGYVWVSALFGDSVWKVSPDGATILGPFSHGSDNAQGLAVSSDGDVWVSSSLFCGVGCTIGHLKNDGTFVGNVPNPTGAGSTGISVDAAGKIWSANLNSNTATRIDPDLGPFGCGGTGCGDGTHVGAVDLTVDFPFGPDGRPLPFPYNYSDMTGAQLLGSTAPQGTWTVTQDGTAPGTAWGTITWNQEPEGTVPAGATLTVEARAADTEAGLGSEAYVAVTSGTPFSLTGRFIQVRVTFKPNGAGDSPILSDIRIQTSTPVVGPPATLDLEPATGTNTVDEEHCVTATVEDGLGSATPGITVVFSVTPTTFRTPSSGSAVTDASGNAEFCYTSALPGDDVISAFADTNGNGVQDPGEPSDTAEKSWEIAANDEDCKVTYGGSIIAANGDQATFGGNGQGAAASGQEQFRDHGPAAAMNVHSINVLSVTCSADGTMASIFGEATIDGAGTFDYRIDVTDPSGPGPDTYRIRLSNGYDSGVQDLLGGNIVIH
ncbi:MAG TPA: post-COAP-1 domain-containing protein [Candidatus Limnocylindrales bacterium]|jgi:hypothetical protein|nr:post-COAP-1 domain-containing protein [Candidatus Limnocylindrales bacterium]